MEAKQQELKRIEEAKQKVVDQGKLSVNSGNKGQKYCNGILISNGCTEIMGFWCFFWGGV